MNVSELLNKQETLEATRSKLQGQLDKAAYDLDVVTEAEQIGTAELVDLQASVSNLTAAVQRIDTALETVDGQLRTAQAAADRDALLDTIAAATHAAQTATAEEQEQYDRLFAELGDLLTRFGVARDAGYKARSHLRALLKTEAPALDALGSWALTTPRQEAAAHRLEGELQERGVDVRSALEGRADLPFGRLLVPLMEAYQREHTPLEAA